MALYDMHCHLDFLPDASDDASEASEGCRTMVEESKAAHATHAACTNQGSAPAIREETEYAEIAPAVVGTSSMASFVASTTALASAGDLRGIRAFSSTVAPSGYLRAVRLLGACGNVRVGLGMHPWWVADGSVGEDEIRLFEERSVDSRFIGEVGLDFASRWAKARDAQVAAFARALDACSGGGKVVSIHAVRSASTVLDMLEARGSCGKNACMMHWFSGTSDELARAIRLGCYFSVNPRMMMTKRGRAYVRAMPVGRLLLETDMPTDEGAPYSVGEWERDLRGVLATIAEERREDVDALAEAIADTSARLLGLY